MAKSARGERWYARRDEIITTIAKCFAKQGYHATGLTELCEAVGLGRGALYYYIESKENALSLIHDQVMDQVLASAHKVMETDASPEELLRALGRELVTIIAVYPDHVWVFMHEFRALNGTRRDHFRIRRHEYEQLVSSVLKRGVDEGLFDIDDVRLMTLAWLGLHNYIYIWFHESGEYRVGDIASNFADLFLSGIRRNQQSLTHEAAPRGPARAGMGEKPPVKLGA